MSERFWTVLSKIDARLVFLLVVVALAALVSEPLIESASLRRRPYPVQRAPAQTGREPEAPRTTLPPLHADIVPFTSVFLERAIAEGLTVVIEPDPYTSVELPPDSLSGQPDQTDGTAPEASPGNGVPDEAGAEPPAGEPDPDPEPAAPVEPTPSDPEPSEPAREEWLLVFRGHMVRPDGRMLGLVERSDTGQSRFYGDGDALGPVLIERIERDTVTARRGDERFMLDRGQPVPVPGGRP